MVQMHFYHGFLWEFETQLRALGKKYECISLPYWDWSLDSGDEANSEPVSHARQFFWTEIVVHEIFVQISLSYLGKRVRRHSGKCLKAILLACKSRSCSEKFLEKF